ncbi:MAG: YggS family pyridoxal phosphate enzyme [Actinobacteria bacterium 13_1_20CM_2_65_11]|nr:MAG: YggS family pyridoxal phosphate enzyme [Chloroflexi bacterium 13_1_40CM_65_17]OLC65153.1 MAG: YggS family pyridoxal phosphate enzyme [Actinobacteria bacterium 13_1_40CM_4_65_12]OLD48414.1 MAG: YggS family pyridoxal phosphate enzyme [Actinobacteria bacterium 13_1_40CM_2_65_8]OLE79960.1 MAG: YggS family pyridoxal phosphate enzyme [Actinobacteria bacterium 13_1_20CM_2_65_11]
MSIPQNLAKVRERISRSGRDPDTVEIVAVTKGFDISVCREALAAGLRVLGENRVHEAIVKMDQLPDAEWHLIGHLQTNKARQAAGRFVLIQSVDSARVAEALARVAPTQQVLVEVNVAREPQKSGAEPAQALEVISAVARMLELKGLMAMGPSTGDPTAAFTELRQLRDRAEERLGKALPVLSMGMSGDFEAALAAGSTMLRLGQVLFGPRPDRSIVM